MRFAILGSRGFPSHYGGYETFVREFAPYAARRGHEVLVYCRWLQDGVPTWRVDGVECRGTPGLEIQSLSTLSFGLSGTLDLRAREFDAVLVLNCANGFWLPLIESADIPTVVNVDGLEWERGKWNSLGHTAFRLGARLAAKRATALVADSRAIADVWGRKYHRRPEYIPYGGHPITDDSTDELDALDIPPGEYVLTVARLVPENNVELTLDALDLLEPSVRPKHVIVGSSRKPTKLTRRLHERSFREDTWWLGQVSNDRLLHQLWRHCRTYVHGHSCGGTNPSLVQALAAGAPTLAFDSVFARQVIGDVDAYFDEDLYSLADRLLGIGASSEYREQLVENGLARARSEFSWPMVCERYLELLADVAGADYVPPGADELESVAMEGAPQA